MVSLEVFDLVATLKDTATTVFGYVGAGIGAGIGVGALMWGGRSAWRAVKSFGK